MAEFDQWLPESNPLVLRRIGKTAEECGELLKVLGRLNSQGLDGTDPESGVVNRLALAQEIADVYAQLDVTIERLSLDRSMIANRRAGKRELMARFEAHLGEAY